MRTSVTIKAVRKTERGFEVQTADGTLSCDRLISTIPIHEFVSLYEGVPEEVRSARDGLRYNSIIIAFVRTPYDLSGANFAFMIPDKDVIFHRISKMDFLGERYHRDSEATYMVEITYREGDYIDHMDQSEIESRISQGLERIGFAKAASDAEFIDVSYHKYAYVIYDLRHGDNMKIVRDYFEKEGVSLNGRFGNFEYWNMDRILRESKNLCEKLEGGK